MRIGFPMFPAAAFAALAVGVGPAWASGTPPLWEESSRVERRTWTAAVHAALLGPGRGLLDSRPSDVGGFCRPYETLSEEGRLAFWSHLISAVARLESSFRPELTFEESFRDASGAKVVSRGLLQLSIESARAYGCDVPRPMDLHDPAQNLECGVRIMTRLVTGDGVVASKAAPWKGAARYWSVLRSKRSQLQRLTSSIAECGGARASSRAGAASLAALPLGDIAVATDESFVETRGRLSPGAPAVPSFPDAGLVGTAELNRPGDTTAGYRFVWTTVESVPAVMRWYQQALVKDGWDFKGPTDGSYVEQVARIAKAGWSGTVSAETAGPVTEVAIVLMKSEKRTSSRARTPSAAFASEPAAGSGITFGVAGDFSSGVNFRSTVAAVKAADPAFLLALGDLSYNTKEFQWCQDWKDAGYEKLVLLSGNHDSGESAGGNINKYVTNCPKAGISEEGTYGKQYYFDYPTVGPLARFILVAPALGGTLLGFDTNYAAGTDGFAFTEKAIDDARAQGIAWIFVGMHKNYISTLEKKNEVSTDKERSFMSMLLRKKVDVIFQGHEHGYERTKQLRLRPTTCDVLKTGSFNPQCVGDADDDLVRGDGSVIHVIGTGGKDVRTLNTADPEFDYFASSNVTAYGFGKFVLTPNRLAFTFVRSAGEPFEDTYTITAVQAPHAQR